MSDKNDSVKDDVDDIIEKNDDINDYDDDTIKAIDGLRAIARQFPETNLSNVIERFIKSGDVDNIEASSMINWYVDAFKLVDEIFNKFSDKIQKLGELLNRQNWMTTQVGEDDAGYIVGIFLEGFAKVIIPIIRDLEKQLDDERLFAFPEYSDLYLIFMTVMDDYNTTLNDMVPPHML